VPPSPEDRDIASLIAHNVIFVEHIANKKYFGLTNENILLPTIHFRPCFYIKSITFPQMLCFTTAKIYQKRNNTINNGSKEPLKLSVACGICNNTNR